MEQKAATNWVPNPVSLFIFSFAAGIFLSSFFFIPPLVALLAFFLALAIFSVQREAWFIILALISFSLGVLRYDIKDFHEVSAPSGTGVVVSEPEDKASVRRFVYEVDNGEKVLVSAPFYTPVAYGDRVEVRGKLVRPGIITDKITGRTFDYGAYLSKNDIYWTESFAEVKVLAHGEASAVKSALLTLKNNFISHIESILPEPEAGLLAGLVVAGKGSLPASVLAEFRRAGVVHIVVLSGFNVTLVAEFLRKLFRRLLIWLDTPKLGSLAQAYPRAPDFAALTGVLLFVLMTGGEATVVRAALMASVAIAARLFGRHFSASRALVFTAFLMLVQNPKLLVFDPSFELSFLATLGLILFSRPIEKRLGQIPTRFKTRENLAQTLATQLTVLPLLIYSTGQLSLVAIPANLLILTIVPFTMLTGFLAALLSYIHWLVAWPLSFASHLLLSWILLVAHLFGSLPFAAVEIPTAFWWVCAAVLLGGGATSARWRSSLRSLPS